MDNFELLEEIKPLEPPPKLNEEESNVLFTHPFYQRIIEKYKASLFPMFLLNRDLILMWANLGFIGDMKPGDLPIDINLIFSEPAESKGNLTNIKSNKPKTGYFKIPVIRYRREKISLRANMVILPLIKKEEKEEVIGYWGFLDDLTKDYMRVYRNTFDSLLEASKLKDNDTGHHIQRVNEFSFILAQRLFNEPNYPQITPDFLQDIGYLAAMHDAGKIGTPDHILTKPGRLDDMEWEIMKEHTINGAFVMSSYPNTMAKEIARSHHEKWDGTGYPFGLQETSIPLSARIVAIADVYDALRSERCYKKAYDHQKTLKIMREEAGSHFDPDIFSQFLSIHKEFEQIYSNLAD